MKGAVRFGTRASSLARWQTGHVARALTAAHPGLTWGEIVIETAGDEDRKSPLPEIGGKGVFTEALERALRENEIDLAVHSLKDLPIEASPSLAVGAICFRADARDVLVARDRHTLDSLPEQAVIGTSSLRRIAQLKALRPDLRFESLRGNVDSRVRAAREGAYDAVCIAAAGVERLGLADVVSEYLPFERLLPAPGQGALAVQCRASDEAMRSLLTAIDDEAVRAAASAERAFLAGVGGGCSAPVGAFGQASEASGTLRLDAVAAAVDGSTVIRVSGTGSTSAAADLGRRLAQDALARGAGALVS